ncbi:Hypothetical predicted protein [Mytilus galloprovincialis]|uniref:SRCR domain-containing protein n=1 Tax=Mytilus galloprovincialis TaxID=29158 RepID=A0A8B6BX31_MYTGA|nr:Hypothetical predicted protein [Mytilus galloprovincialis]
MGWIVSYLVFYCFTRQVTDASQVRLVDGKSVYENGVDVYQGRLEVFYNQEWGNVCDDNFNQTSAKVVCRMLGFEGEIAEVVIDVIETIIIPEKTSPEDMVKMVLKNSNFWNKILNVTGKMKKRIIEQKLVKRVQESIQKTLASMINFSISCNFVQYLETMKTEVVAISSPSNNLIKENEKCYKKVAQFEENLSVIENLVGCLMANHVEKLIPICSCLRFCISLQRKTFDDDSLTMQKLYNPNPYLLKIISVADTCRLIEKASSTCVFWNIVRQDLENFPEFVDHTNIKFVGFGFGDSTVLLLEDQLFSNLVITEKILCRISEECIQHFESIWYDYAHAMNQKIFDTVHIFHGTKDMASEMQAAEEICQLKLPPESRNCLVRFSRFKLYKETVQLIKIAAKSFHFQETSDSIYHQTVAKFEKMIEGKFSDMTLKEITPVLDQIHTIREIINMKEHLSDIISAVNESSSLLDFLREVIDEDIRNLINAVEEHSEQYVRESTVSDLIEVKRFFDPILKTEFTSKIEDLFKLLQSQYLKSGIRKIPEKIGVCRNHLHSLRALYLNVANRGEHTMDLINNIMLKGTFHFILKKRKCRVLVLYDQEKIKHDAVDLYDLRCRALLMKNTDKKVESEQKNTTKEKLDDFVFLIDIAFEIKSICLNLKLAGHFAFACFEKKCRKDEMVSLKKTLKKEFDDWTKYLKVIRAKYFYMNFLFSDQLYDLYMFLKGNENADKKNRTCVTAVLNYMGLPINDLLPIQMIYQEMVSVDPDNYRTALENIGKTLDLVGDKILTTTRNHKFIGEDKLVPLFEKVQPGKPYFAWLDDNSQIVIKVLLALYHNTTNLLPEANQVIFCSEETTYEEIDLLIQRCMESSKRSQAKVISQTKKTSQTEETSQTQEISHTKETSQTKVTSQTEETSQTQEISHRKNISQTKEISQTKNTSQTNETPQRRETPQTKQKPKKLFTIVNVEFLKREVQINLHDRIRNLSEDSNGAFLLCLLCRGSETSPFVDKFKDSLLKLSPISESKMDECFKKHCSHVLVVTSDLPGAGKTELIQSKAIKDRKRCVTIHISGPFNRMSTIEILLQLELKYYHALHIDIGIVSDSFGLDVFLFELIVLRFVSAGSTAYALTCDKVYIEIANSVKNELCDSLSTLTSFQREHLKWKDYDDVKVSIDINSPMQVVCRYLKALDEGSIDNNNLFFNGPDAVKPLSQRECKTILCQKFNTLDDMSYTLVNIFIRVLADQLKKLSSSVYFQTSTLKAIMGEDNKSTVRSQIVKALVHLTGIFSIRSVHTCRTFQAAFLLRSREKDLNVAKILTERVSGMIRWDEGNHLMILFNKDMQSISAIYRHLSTIPKFIKQLVESQTQTPLVSFDLKETTELENLLIQLTRLSDTAIYKKEADKLRKEYVLTPDNVLKMILISMRINTRIPVIIMGETGCGKTSLIRYLANFCGINMDTFSIHAGTSEDEIYSRITVASQNAFKNVSEVHWLFLDEINTCDHLGIITSAICHRFCNNCQLAPNLALLAACNPYRLRSEDSIYTTGLQGKIKTDNLSHLVYRVHPLPETMMDFVWDYGSLSQKDEVAYITKMVETVKFDDLSEKFSNVLVMSQTFVREMEGNDYCVSLRDVDRCIKLVVWLFHSFLKKKNDNMNIETKQINSIVLSLAICYHSRFGDVHIREKYREKSAAIISLTEDDLENIILDEQKYILQKMEYLPEGTALNIALQENIFMLLVCILSKIPIFLVGKPGCSKSLSIQLLRSNLRGKDSSNEFFKDMPQLFCVSFQGSESSTSEGILKVFEKAKKYQQHNDENDVLTVVILDEIGLAENSRFNPLKVLHELLEPGSGQLNISVVGISNWALDAAKMNRAIHLSRPDMNSKEIMLTGQSICTSMLNRTEKEGEFGIPSITSNGNKNLNANAQKLINGIACGYYEFYSKQQKIPNFHSLRDFYSLTKYIGRRMEYILSLGQEKIAEVILIGILRNFGGLPTEQEYILQFFSKYIPCIVSTPIPVMRLIRENIEDKTSRHLMIITRGNVVISVLERELNEMKLPFDIIYGSNFDGDLSDDYNYRILSRIILCMEQGMVLIMKNLEAIYGSLYDMLNQNYTCVGKQKNCRVALGHYSNPMCHVHDKFKCIVLVEESTLDCSDPPFLNRFEKQYFQLIDLLEAETMQPIVTKITEEITSLCQIPNYSFIPEDVIPSFSLDLIVSLVVHLSKTVGEEHIHDNAFGRLLWLFPPEVIVRAKESKYALSKKNFIKEIIVEFMKLPIHDGICNFFINFAWKSRSTNDGSSDGLIKSFVIYTYSSLHSIVEDDFNGYQIQKQKIATFKSEKEFTTTVENFFSSEKSVFLLQCSAASDNQKILLTKDILEKAIRKYKLTCESEKSRKFVFIVIHVYRDSHVHLPINYLSSWNLLFMDSIEKPRTSLNHFIKVDKLEIVRERMPLHGYITDSLFWVLSRIKFISEDSFTGFLLDFLLESLRSCKDAMDTLEEMIVAWIEKQTMSESSGKWCLNVAKSPRDLVMFSTFIDALENNIKDFIKTPLSKYIFLMIDQNIVTPVIFVDEFTKWRRESWKNCILSTEHLNIKYIAEPSGPECYSCSSRFLYLKMPFSQMFSQSIEKRKDNFLNIVRRHCIELNIEEDEEIPNSLFEHEINHSYEIIFYDAIVIESYLGQNDDYIHDFSYLFLSQICIIKEPNGMQVFIWALSKFIDISAYRNKKFEHLVAALHASVWVYGSILKTICLIALDPSVSSNFTYHIPLKYQQKLQTYGNYDFASLENNADTAQESKAIRIADLNRESFVRVICLSLLPTLEVLKQCKISNWLSNVRQMLPLAHIVYCESSELRCLKLCHEISEALFDQNLSVDNYIYKIAESLKTSNGAIYSKEVCNVIFETLKDLHQSKVDGRIMQHLFCSYIIRCLKLSSENVYPFQFALSKIASNDVFDKTLSYFGQVFKYALALDAETNPNVFWSFLSQEVVLDEQMPFCKCLNECLLKSNHNLDHNKYLLVLVTDILEDFAFSEDLSIDEIKSSVTVSSQVFTCMARAFEIVGKGIHGVKSLISVAYIRSFLKKSVSILDSWKYDCNKQVFFAQQINAVLSTNVMHLFLQIIEHVSGQENMEKILRKLDNTITSLRNIKWNNEVVEEMPVYNPLIMYAEENELLLQKYKLYVLEVLKDTKPLVDILENYCSPDFLICVLVKEYYMKKCFRQLNDEEKRTAKAVGEIIRKAALEKSVKSMAELFLGLKAFRHSIFDISEVVESPIPQIVSVMIHLAFEITLNYQENKNTVWYRALFNPSSIKCVLPDGLPAIIYHIIKIICYSCFTFSYGFALTDTKLFDNVTPGDTVNLEEYLQETLQESWKYLHLHLEINYFDICLLLHELVSTLFKSEKFHTAKNEINTENFDEQFITEYGPILEDILENRIQVIHEVKKYYGRKTGNELQQCVLNVTPCNLDVNLSNEALVLRFSGTSSNSILLTEIQAGCKKRFKFLTTVVNNMQTLMLPKHLSSFIKWHLSVVTLGTYKFRKVDFKDMTVSSFLCAFHDDCQRNVLEKAFNEFAKSWNEIRLAVPSLKDILQCSTVSGKISLNLMHKNVTMKECTVMEDNSIFVEVIKGLANIQNQFLKDSGTILANEESKLNNSLSLQDVRSVHLINFKWDDDWEDYCQCETLYGLGKKINFYCDMIEKDMEQDMLFGKVLVEIPNPLMKIIFIDDLFQNCIELLNEISRNVKQRPLPYNIKTAIEYKKSKDRSYIGELLTHLGMALSLLRKKGLGSENADISILHYLNSLTHITGMSSSVIKSLFPGDIRICHSVNLYQWLEELNGESIIETLEDEYRVKLSDNAIQCLQEAKQNMKHLKKLEHPLKVFVHRSLSVKDNKIRSAQPLNEYLSNKDLWWPGDLKYDDALKKVAIEAEDNIKPLDELLSPLILVENIHDTVNCLASAIKEAEAKEKEPSFFKMEKTRNEKQQESYKKEQTRQVIKKKNKRL